MASGLALQLDMDCLHLEDEVEQNEPLEPFNESVANAQRENEGFLFLRVLLHFDDDPLKKSQSNAHRVHAHGDNRGELH